MKKVLPFLIFLVVTLVLTVAVDYFYQRYGDRRLCDRQCNHAQCACVETCPVERQEVSAKDLDAVLNDLNRTMNAGRFIGNTVVYERDEWDRIQEDITEVVRICTVKHPPQSKRKS